MSVAELGEAVDAVQTQPVVVKQRAEALLVAAPAAEEVLRPVHPPLDHRPPATRRLHVAVGRQLGGVVGGVRLQHVHPALSGPRAVQ